MYQQIPQGSRGYELGYAEQFKYSNVSSSDSDVAKVNAKACSCSSADHLVAGSLIFKYLMLIIFFYRDTCRVIKKTQQSMYLLEILIIRPLSLTHLLTMSPI